MAPRQRSGKNKSFPRNLYVQIQNGATYFKYRHPITKKYHPLGKDKAEAIAAARVLNDRLLPDTDMTGKVLGLAEQSFSRLVERYKNELLPEKNLEASTLAHYERRLGRLDKDLGSKPVESFTVADCADYLDKNFVRDSYIKHRGVLIELFNFAMTKGFRSDNPAEPTRAKNNVEKVRQRMKLEEFKAIHAMAPDWMQIAMELALITLQGRYEVCNMKFTDVKDGRIFIVREKTKKNEWAHISIEINETIQDILTRSRKSGLVSPFVVHREPERRNKAKDREHWTQLTLNDFTAKFRDIRDSCSIFAGVPREERPTFHEIRALGAWLYEKQGFDRGSYVQQLMAHSDEKMTQYYQSGHEQKWMQVKAELSLSEVLKSG